MTNFPLPAELAGAGLPFTDEFLDAWLDDHDQLARVDPAFAAKADEVVGEWRIEDDASAEWAGRKLALAEQRIDTQRQLRDEWVARIDAWFAETTKHDSRTAEYMTTRLEDYAIRRREAGGDATLTLPSVTVRTTGLRPTIAVTDDAVLANTIEWINDLGDNPAADDADIRRFDAWQRALGDAEVRFEDLVQRKAKVYVGPLRKVTWIGAVESGWAYTASLACGHQIHATCDGLDDVAVPGRGEIVYCPACPVDAIEGPARSPIDVVVIEPVRVPAALGPDGEPLPGTEVVPGGVTAKVTVRG